MKNPRRLLHKFWTSSDRKVLELCGMFLGFGLYGGFFAAVTVLPMVTPVTVTLQPLKMPVFVVLDGHWVGDFMISQENLWGCEAALREQVVALREQVAKNMNGVYARSSLQRELDDCRSELDMEPCKRNQLELDDCEAQSLEYRDFTHELAQFCNKWDC